MGYRRNLENLDDDAFGGLRRGRVPVRRRKELPVTVCIAAIAQNMLIAASDRMLTAEDIQFEPRRVKIFRLTNSILIMNAGEDSLNTEIVAKVWKDVQGRIREQPDNWWVIRDVVELYSRYYSEEITRQAEAAVLIPIGLTLDSFIEQQSSMSEETVKRTEGLLRKYFLETQELEAIICGLDASGLHIYVINKGDISCRDSVGFAAIGAGERHAESQLMFAGHARSNSVAETMLLVHSAKKRAEVAPGVGRATDMFYVGPTLGSSGPIDRPHLDKLDLEFRAMRKAEERAAKRASERVRVYMDRIVERMQEQQQATPASPEGASSSTEP